MSRLGRKRRLFESDTEEEEELCYKADSCRNASATSLSDMTDEMALRSGDTVTGSEAHPPSCSTFTEHLHAIVPEDPSSRWPLNILDYLPVFPHPLDSDFQRRISSKREFAMLHSTMGEMITDGELYSQQKFVRLFLSHYDRLLLVSEPGTGKTCSVVSFCEMISRMQLARVKNSLTKIEKFIILVKSPFHVTNIRQMIHKVCSGGHYSTDNSMSWKNRSRKSRRYMTGADTADHERRMAKKMIKDVGYKITTYTSFTNELRDKYLTPNKLHLHTLKKDFSDTLVWVDEVHNIALTPNQLNRRDETKAKDATYWILHRLFHEVERMTIVLSSATPMLNNAGEIVSIVNLLRPENGKPPSNWNWRTTDPATFEFRFNAAEAGLNRSESSLGSVVPRFVGQMNPQVDVLSLSDRELEQHLRGIVMYSRQDPVGVNIKWMGDVGKVNLKDKSSVHSLPGMTHGKIALFKSTMSDLQSEVFDDVYGGVTDNQNFFFQRSRNVSNFVFHTSKDIRVGFEQNMILSADDTYRATVDFAAHLSDIANIKRSSCKFEKIVNLCQTEPGNCFVYGEHVEGGGLYVLAACLEAQGFKRYCTQSSMLDSQTGKVKEPLASTNINRYVIFTAATQNNFSNIMELMNCKANAEGRYIKVFISSKIGREGITIKNVQHIHLVSPEWTSSGIFQATSRGIRAKAHVDLKDAIATRSGLESEIQIDVKIYLHCAISKTNNSIDRNMYMTAERKDKGIQKIMTIAKRVAVNCQLDYDKNVRPVDRETGSHYEPYDPWASIGSDESSYKLYMYPTIANHIKDHILTNLHRSHSNMQTPRQRQSQSQSQCILSAVTTPAPTEKGPQTQTQTQTLANIMARFEHIFQTSSMAYAIQWMLRDHVHCMDIYARPGRMDISEGLVYYSTCTGVRSANYSDVIMGVRTLPAMELVSICEERYYSLITESLNPKHMTVNTFAKLLRSNRQSTVGSIHLIEATIKIAVDIFGVDSVDLWTSIDQTESISQGSTHGDASNRYCTQEAFAPYSHSTCLEDALEGLKRYIMGLQDLGITAKDFGTSSDTDDYNTIPEDDDLGIAKNTLLKFWYIMKMYRALFFVFREPVAQLDRWYGRVMRAPTLATSSYTAAKLTVWNSTKVEVKRALGRQHSSIRKIWTTKHYDENQAINSQACKVLVHILHVLDNASTAYSIVPSISKAECRTRVLHLTIGGGSTGWRDVSNKEFFTYNPVIQSISNLNLLAQSKRGMHGIVYDQTFRICEPDPDFRFNDSRLKKKGKLCSTMSCTKLKYILATMYTRPSDDVILADAAAARKQRLTRRGNLRRRAAKEEPPTTYVPDEYASSLNDEQTEIYLEWATLSNIKVSTLCSMVKSTMVKYNRVLYYNISMT